MKSITFAVGLSILVLAVAGCGGEEDIGGADDAPVVEAVDSAAKEIVGGRRESRYAGVGYVLNVTAGRNAQNQLAICGATLVAPRVAVTAAHCVPDTRARYTVGFGEVDSWREIPVRMIYRHPEYSAYRSDNYRHDIAALVLAWQPNAAPLAIATPRVPSIQRVVGYGRTTRGFIEAAGPNGERRSAVVRVEQNDGLNLFTRSLGAGLCYGDSGSGLIDESGRQLFGVLASLSSTSYGYCSGYNTQFFTSVAAERRFVDAAIACQASGETRCVERRLGVAAPRCTWTCAAYGFRRGECRSGYYCDGACITLNGCR